MRAVSLHSDVVVVTSALLAVNCVIVRGPRGPAVTGGPGAGGDPGAEDGEGAEGGASGATETFVIDSPVLPDELDALPSLVEQAGFPAPSGLLATHGDWDHLLGRLAFPDAALGCAESTAERFRASPGEAQRELRAFDEELLIERARPLALGAVQPLPVPGRCTIGAGELQLHLATGHTPDGMAIAIPWAGVVVAGDYLSTVELPTLNDGGDVDEYAATLERLRELVSAAQHVVPGHGPVMGRARALEVLEEDASYLRALVTEGAAAKLPADRAGAAQRQVHAQNAASLSAAHGS